MKAPIFVAQELQLFILVLRTYEFVLCSLVLFEVLKDVVVYSQVRHVETKLVVAPVAEDFLLLWVLFFGTSHADQVRAIHVYRHSVGSVDL